MSRFRDIKYKARRDLHQTMRVPVYVFPNIQGGMPKLVYARIHRVEDSLGNVKGTSFGYSERREQEPKVIFLTDEHRGERGEAVVVSKEEAYRLDNDEPVYNVTVSWYVVALDEDQRSMLAGPEDAVYTVVEASFPRLGASVDVLIPAPSLPFIDMNGAAKATNEAAVTADFPPVGFEAG
jgi:hypothetical protein